MFTIQTIGKISDIIQKELPAESYRIAMEDASPDAAIVRSASMHEMKAPPSLLAVARAGAGTNNIPVKAYTKQGIAVFNTPGANANAVAELVILGMLLSGRKVIPGIDWVRTLKGKEDVPALVEKGKGQFIGPELRGKTLGVIGLGAIGVLVANAAAAGLGMKVIGLDPYVSISHAWALSRAVTRAQTLEEMLPLCDFVSIHVPLTDKTRHMMNASRFAQMKPGAHLLNFSRAELVEQAALAEALSAEKLALYVTDFPTGELVENPQVICIPHLGASTPESEENCAVMAASSLHRYLQDGSIVNSVNLPDMLLSEPEGYRLQIIHDNVPGIVAQISSIISQKSVNIINMLNKSRDEIAVTVLELSDKPSESMIHGLLDIPQVRRARVIHL